MPQQPFLARLVPHTSNTLRVLTARDEEGWFLIGSALKLGTSQSWPVDHPLRAGISVSVDCASGRRLSPRFIPGERDEPELTAHPETSIVFQGRQLPHWDEVLALLDTRHRLMPSVLYAGWNFLMTAHRVCVIEGNEKPGLGLLQVHGPLVTDPRTETFYRRCGVFD